MKEIDLKKLLEPMEYKTRVGPGGKSLAYIDARQAQDRLDEVCGIENWKVEYAEYRGELFAGVSIKIDGEWIIKWDGGTESNIEKEKGAISDSFKRACVVWGLGRFLYNIKPSQSKTTTPTTPTTPKKDYGAKKYFNYENLIETIDCGNITKEAIWKVIQDEGFTLSKNGTEAIKYYLETGDIGKDLKSLFFNK